MNEQEFPLIQITTEDIDEANRLSLHCPICAGAVEANVELEDLTPVVCTSCGTLYHKACWEQKGGKCAMLGCENDEFRLYGQQTVPTVKVDYADIGKGRVNGRSPNNHQRRLKEEQRRQVEQMRRPGLFQRLFKWLLDQIKVG